MAAADVLLEPGCCNPLCYDPILFEQLNGDLIKWSAFCTHGAAGPSGVDIYAWVCCKGGKAFKRRLVHSVALIIMA